MLKAELHTHTNDDPRDKFVKHSVYQLIDRAKELNYDVLAITCHNHYFQNKDAEKYAKDRGIILINGIEKDIEGKHTLIYNTTKEIEKIHTIQSLKKFKKKNPDILIIAAHPFHFDPSCHGRNIIKHKNLFDAWEYSFFYSKWCNPNKITKYYSRKHKKPLVGNCDVHQLNCLGSTYSLIDAKKNKQEIFKAIKNGKIKVVSKPISSKKFLRIVKNVLFSKVKKIVT